MQMFNEQSLNFQEKIMERSGLGDDTYLPHGMPNPVAPSRM